MNILKWFIKTGTSVVVEVFIVGFIVGVWYFLANVFTGGAYQMDYWSTVQSWAVVVLILDFLYWLSTL